jgi:hypothetical protein
MDIINLAKDYIKITPFAIPYIVLKHFFIKKGKSQSNESEIIDRLVNKFNPPKLFVEFGFSGWEFNCIKLTDNWVGLLLDGNPYNVKIANILFHKRVTSRQLWITLDTIEFVFDYLKSNKDVGILSVDVDGNDYWFLEKLIVTKPAIIVAEFNVAFGLHPISVPYDSDFDRTVKHESWLYYGASLSAINHLCNLHGYSLVEVSQNGVNAFFVRDDLLSSDDLKLTVEEGYKVKCYPDGTTSSQNWDFIKHLPYVDVTTAGASHKSDGITLLT